MSASEKEYKSSFLLLLSPIFPYVTSKKEPNDQLINVHIAYSVIHLALDEIAAPTLVMLTK